jgi:predicted phosphodiesterase
LHIGDGSSKDAFSFGNREYLLASFLDHIDHEQGQLIIIGDLLELWRYYLDDIFTKRHRLLDQLADINAVFVPGNHDADTKQLAAEHGISHRFLENIAHPFVKTIAGKRFKFTHGHEVDPFMGGCMQSVSRMFAPMAHLLEFRNGACIVSHDAVVGTLLELAENVLILWNWLANGMERDPENTGCVVPKERFAWLRRRLRTHNTANRFYQGKSQGIYDVVVTGHTHKAGRFDDWYFNSGSWTGRRNNFLRISPDGTINIFDWSRHGAESRDIALSN